MIREGEIIFNDKSSLDLNLRLTNYPKIPLSNEEIEEVPIFSRRDNLIIKSGTYGNKHVKFVFTRLKEKNMLMFDDIFNWLTNIKDNKFFYWKTDRCLRVKNINIGDFEQEFKEFGTITIEFIFYPFWEDPQEVTYEITESGFSFLYKANAPSDPQIILYGTGNLQLTINGETIQIKDVEDYVIIDNELMQVRDKNGQSKDFDTTGNYVELTQGEYTIEFDSNTTKVLITYRNKWRG